MLTPSSSSVHGSKNNRQEDSHQGVKKDNLSGLPLPDYDNQSDHIGRDNQNIPQTGRQALDKFPSRNTTSVLMGIREATLTFSGQSDVDGERLTINPHCHLH